MDRLDILWISIGGYLIHLLITWHIIQSATHSEIKRRNTIAQTKLLAEIARQNGVTDEEIQSIYDDLKIVHK